MSKYASLSAGLLARKGEAEPAATPFAEQLLTRVGVPAMETDVSALTPMPHHRATSVTPLVQDPPGSPFGSFGKRTTPDFDRPRKDVSPIVFERPSHVAAQNEQQLASDHCGTCAGPGPDDIGKTYHVNLRLKRTRFVKLKLSAALLRRPVQDVVAEALDNWFDALPADVMGDCVCLKSRD